VGKRARRERAGKQGGDAFLAGNGEHNAGSIIG
jgi:hypothetical protein